MKEPSASRCASHGSVMAVPRSMARASSPRAQHSEQDVRTAGPGIPGPAAHVASLGRGSGPRGLAVGLALRQRGGRVEHVLRELALAGQQLLGEVVGVRHDIFRLRELVGERHAHGGQLRHDRLDGVGPGLDRVDNGLLALADGLDDLVLQFLPGVTGLGHDYSSWDLSWHLPLANYTKQTRVFVKRTWSAAVSGRPARGAAPRSSGAHPLAKPRASKRAGHAQNDGDARPGPPISAGVWSGESLVHLEQVDLVWLYSGPAGALPRCPVPCSGANLC